uniref:Large ribosomal subunit protein uL29c n=1 Tax=Helminthora furcellata TaxID=1884666 RepID=A0A1G4NZF8_9FLOR|nr:Ribosomal protein L29 [Helminthora furcellata]SCW21188.1 Ribosomal protein L29 [Helminthora furcellata]SCW24048.1 Ribosomal protein L29 [Helminthora furcellata]
MDDLSLEKIRSMDYSSMDIKILEIKKILFDFRMKQATRQSFKPHLVKKYKKQLSQIMTIKTEKIIHENMSS